MFFKKKPEQKSYFVQDRDQFLSIWALAHEWEGGNPQESNANDVPGNVRRCIDKLILAYFRKELTLRKANGYRVLGHRFLEKMLGLDKDFDRLWDCLTKGVIDVSFLDNVFVMRSEVLRWCPIEFIDPPLCWSSVQIEVNFDVDEKDEDSDKAEWYSGLTESRRRKVACLELARYLWSQNETLSYEDVRSHSLMKQAGLHNVFSLVAFKKWSRDFAPEAIKLGGRRSISMA